MSNKNHVLVTVVNSVTNVVLVEFDACDYSVKNKADIELIKQFACDVISDDCRKGRPSYENGDHSIEATSIDLNPSEEQVYEHEAERMTPPDDWVERRVRQAMHGYVDRVCKKVSGERSEIIRTPGSHTNMSFSRAVVINGVELHVNAPPLDMYWFITDRGAFQSHRFSGAKEFRESLIARVREAFDVKWHDDEIWTRFQSAFGWKEDW